MEELTPELERRVQVEEAWARRTVLSDMLNERRLAAYEARRMLLRLHNADFSLSPIEAPKKASKPQSNSAVLENIVPARRGPDGWHVEPSSPRRTRYGAGAIAATALVLLGTAALSGQISWAELAATYSPHDLLEQEGPAPADVLAKTVMDLPPSARTESSTLVERDDQAKQASPAQAPDLREEVRLRIQALQQVADRADQHSEATGESAGR
jgi:hypothetical protein